MGAVLLGAAVLLILADRAVAAWPGDLDATFGAHGVTRTDLGGQDFASAIASQGDGRLLVAGGRIGLGCDMAVARYRPDGTLDETFNDDGIATISFNSPDTDDAAYAVAVQPDGKTLVAGETLVRSPDGATSWDFAVARLNVDGTPDDTFSGDGKVVTDFGHDEAASGILLQPDGRILVTGRSSNAQALTIARYNPDGSLDPTYGSGGRLTASISGAVLYLDASQRIVVAGSSRGDIQVARLLPSGERDASFGAQGVTTVDFGGHEHPTAVTPHRDGVLVLGYTDGSRGSVTLARLDASGSLDTTFAVDGRSVTDVGAGSAAEIITQPDGRFLVAGAIGRDSVALDAFLARYLPDGRLDPSFSPTGAEVFDLGGVDGVGGLLLQPNGRIVLAGTIWGTDSQPIDVVIRRHLGGGALPSVPALRNSVPARACARARARRAKARARLKVARRQLRKAKRMPVRRKRTRIVVRRKRALRTAKRRVRVSCSTRAPSAPLRITIKGR